MSQDARCAVRRAKSGGIAQSLDRLDAELGHAAGKDSVGVAPSI